MATSFSDQRLPKIFYTMLSSPRKGWRKAAVVVFAPLFLSSCEERAQTPGSLGSDHAAVPDRLPNLAARVRQSVFLLEVRDKTNSLISTGTGFLINDEGWLVTNRHVIEVANSVTAKAYNGNRYESAGVLSFDVLNDIAIIKLNTKGLPYLKIEDNLPTQKDVGKAVAVIGNPLGLESSVSTGIISAIREEQVANGINVSYIQTTAPISPGSSGSPVLTMSGMVVGIAASSSQARSQNLNFAVPAQKIHRMIPKTDIIPFSQFKEIYYLEQISFTPEYSNYLVASRSGNLESALRYAEILVEQFPENPECYVNLANTLRKLGLFELALEAIQKNLNLEPDGYEGLLIKGWIHLNQNAYNEAIDSFQKSLDLKNDNVTAWDLLGESLSQSHRHAEAADAFRKSIELNPDVSSTWSDLGKSLLALDPLDEKGDAQSALEKSLRLDQENFGALMLLGRVLEYRQPAKAITYFQRATSLDPKSNDALSSLGNAYKSNGNLLDSERAFRKILENSPNDLPALNDLASILIDLGRTGEAIGILQKALSELKNQPNSYPLAAIYRNLGLAHANTELGKSIEYLQESLKTNQKDADTWHLFGVSLMKRNRIGEAATALSRMDGLENSDLYWSITEQELIKSENSRNAYSLTKLIM
jgi:tetratricopeptide (TPR) repeat protein